MLLMVLGLIFGQALVFAGFSWLAVRWYNKERARTLDELSEAVRMFMTPPDPNTPSPLAVLADQCAILLSARLIQRIKDMLAGVESGASKGEQLAMINEATSQNPWLALIAGILPARLRNALMKNPQMIGALSKIGGGNHQSDSGATASQRSFEL
jgi:hypothetical protein